MMSNVTYIPRGKRTPAVAVAAAMAGGVTNAPIARALRLASRTSAARAPMARALASNALPYPRAAVSCVLRAASAGDARYLLVKRSKPPGAGAWSLAGGKLELGETALQASLRACGARACRERGLHVAPRYSRARHRTARVRTSERAHAL